MTTTDPPVPVEHPPMPDLLDQLAAIQPDSPLAQLRGQRPDVARYTQGSYLALLEPTDPTGVSRLERELIALRVAVLNTSQPLIDFHRQRLAELRATTTQIAAAERAPVEDGLTPRQAAILRHVDLVTTEPRAATPVQLAELQAHGLSTADIVILAQLIAFLNFQVRLLAGLQLLAEEQ
jgi:CMD domain protein